MAYHQRELGEVAATEGWAGGHGGTADRRQSKGWYQVGELRACWRGDRQNKRRTSLGERGDKHGNTFTEDRNEVK